MTVVRYIMWHYTQAPFGILVLTRNYVIGTWHRFLIARHFNTLFAPWHRATPASLLHPQTAQDKIASFVVGIFIRLVAAFLRLLVISIGLIALGVVILGFVGLLLVWIAWPVLLVMSISYGLS